MSRAGGRGLGAHVARGVRHARWTARSRLAEHPAYLPVARRRHGEAVVSESTELVIDGFTRSASTFAVVAFQLAQARPVRVGHHLHAAGQITQAVRLGVPVLLTVRPPEDTVLSLVVREPYVTIPQGLHAYARFHERLLDDRDGMVVADFAEVTERLERSIARVNERFGTGFAAPELTPEGTREAFDLIEMRSRRPPWRGAIHDFLTGLVPYAELERRAAADPAVTAAVAEDRAARPSDHKGAAQGRPARRLPRPRARAPARAGGRPLRDLRGRRDRRACWQILTVDVTQLELPRFAGVDLTDSDRMLEPESYEPLGEIRCWVERVEAGWRLRSWPRWGWERQASRRRSRCSRTRCRPGRRTAV